MPKKINFFIPLGTKIKDPEYLTEYKLKQLIGRGAFAQCFLAEIETGEEFALKIIKLSELKSEKVKEKLETEISIHAKLAHPRIVKMYRSFRDPEFVYIVLEYCKGGGLDSELKKRAKFTEQETRIITEQLLEGLKYLHEEVNVVHRDLKLGNLFVLNEIKKNEPLIVKLGDFGLSAEIRSGQKKRTVCGTPNYIAPEVLFDKNNGHSFEADLWSLGVMIYTMIVGTPPFQKKDVKEIYKMIEINSFTFPDYVSSEAKELIQSILTTDPMKRPSIEEIKSSKFMAGRESIFTKMSKNISSAVFVEPEIDYPIMIMPLSKIKGIGYTLKSDHSGVYFNDHSSMLIKNGSDRFMYIGVLLNGTKKVLRREEHLISKMPPELLDKYERVCYFVKNFTKTSKNKINPNIESSFVVRVKKMESGILIGLWNNLVMFDFNNGTKVYAYDEGKKIWAINDNKEVTPNDQIMEEMKNALKSQCHK